MYSFFQITVISKSWNDYTWLQNAVITKFTISSYLTFCRWGIFLNHFDDFPNFVCFNVMAKVKISNVILKICWVNFGSHRPKLLEIGRYCSKKAKIRPKEANSGPNRPFSSLLILFDCTRRSQFWRQYVKFIWPKFPFLVQNQATIDLFRYIIVLFRQFRAILAYIVQFRKFLSNFSLFET